MHKTWETGLWALMLWALASVCSAEGIYDLDVLAARTEGGNTHLLVRLTDNGTPWEWDRPQQSGFFNAPTRCAAQFAEYAKHDADAGYKCYVVRLWESEQPQPVVKVHILDNLREYGYVLLSYPSPFGADKSRERRIRIQMGVNGYYNANFEDTLGTVESFASVEHDPRMPEPMPTLEPARPWHWLYIDADIRLNLLYSQLVDAPDFPTLRVSQRQWVKEKETRCSTDPLWRCRWQMTAERVNDLRRLLESVEY
ncbi:MAG: DUF1311 domain-containing protein [Zoogloeaceae bacterium]|jgi:hypothetical protein|nr:DUF1311 domain-containing protein [Zoogloeaceae bacterium]